MGTNQQVCQTDSDLCWLIESVWTVVVDFLYSLVCLKVEFQVQQWHNTAVTAPFLFVSLWCECCFNNEAGCGPPHRCIHTFSYSPWITAGLTPLLASSHQDAGCWLKLLKLSHCEVRWTVWIPDFICRFFFLNRFSQKLHFTGPISLTAVGPSCCFYLCPEHYLHSI